MDFETLERLWRSNANDLPKTAQAYLLEDMMKTLAHRRRQFHTFTGFIGLLLLVWTAALGWAFLSGGLADLRHEWGAAAMLVVSWAAFLIMQAQYRRHMRRYPYADATLPEALAGLLDENRTARARARLMLMALIVFLIALAIALYQLHAVGKMQTRHVAQFALIMGGALSLSVLMNVWRYVRVLKPEGERLARLLAGYRD